MIKSFSSKIISLIALALWAAASLVFLLINIQAGEPLLFFFVEKHYSFWLFAFVGYGLQIFLSVLAIWGILSILYIPCIFAPTSKITKIMQRISFAPAIIIILTAIAGGIQTAIWVTRVDHWAWLFLFVPLIGIAICVIYGITLVLFIPSGIIPFEFLLDFAWDGEEKEYPFKFWKHFLITLLVAFVFFLVASLIGSIHFLFAVHTNIMTVIIVILILIGLIVLGCLDSVREKVSVIIFKE